MVISSTLDQLGIDRLVRVRSAEAVLSRGRQVLVQWKHLHDSALVALGDEPLVQHLGVGHCRIPAVLGPSRWLAPTEDCEDGGGEKANRSDDNEDEPPENQCAKITVIRTTTESNLL